MGAAAYKLAVQGESLSSADVFSISVPLAMVASLLIAPYTSTFLQIFVSVGIALGLPLVHGYFAYIKPVNDSLAAPASASANKAASKQAEAAVPLGPVCRACSKPMAVEIPCECGKIQYCSSKCLDADSVRHRHDCPLAKLPFVVPLTGVRASHLASLFPAAKTAGLSVQQVAADLIRSRRAGPLVTELAKDASSKKQLLKDKADCYVVYSDSYAWDDLVATLVEIEPLQSVWLDVLCLDLNAQYHPKALLPELAAVMAKVKKVEVIIQPSTTFKNAYCSWQVVQASALACQTSAHLTPLARAELRKAILEGAPQPAVRQLLSANEGSDEALTREAGKQLGLLKSVAEHARAPERLLAHVVDDVFKEATTEAGKANAQAGLVIYSKGLLANARGESAKARAHFEKAGEIWLQQCMPAVAPSATAPRSFMGLAGVLVGQGSADSAVKLIEQAIALDTILYGRSSLKVARDLVLLAQCLLAKAKPAEAKAALEESLLVARGEESCGEDEIAESLLALGDAQLALGDSSKALASYEEATKKFQASARLPHAQVRVARALAAVNRKHEALKVFSEALESLSKVHRDLSYAAWLEEAARLAKAEGTIDQATKWGVQAVSVYTDVLGVGNKVVDRAAAEWGASIPNPAIDPAQNVIDMLRNQPWKV